MVTDESKVIDIDYIQGGLHLISKEEHESIKKMYEEIDKRPLLFSRSDSMARVTYYVAPFKYKTAGFDHQLIHSDIGFVWGILGHLYLDLKDLPIDYNFNMAKEFYKNWTDGLLNEFTRRLKIFINGLYGRYTFNAVDSRPIIHYTSTVYQDIFSWLYGKCNITLVRRGQNKQRLERIFKNNGK